MQLWTRETILLEFHSRLQLLVKEHAKPQRFEWAALSLRRVNLILEELFGNHQDSSATAQRESKVTKSPLRNDAGETLWVRCRILFL